MWLPPGGHLEPDELPDAAALREVLEETGLEVDLYDPRCLKSKDNVSSEIKDAVDLNGIISDNVRELTSPYCILLEDIEPGHQHIDLIYFAISRTCELKPKDGCIREFKWLDPVGLNDFKPLKEDVRILAKRAIVLLSEFII